MKFETRLIYALYTPYSIYSRMAIALAKGFGLRDLTFTPVEAWRGLHDH